MNKRNHEGVVEEAEWKRILKDADELIRRNIDYFSDEELELLIDFFEANNYQQCI
jgi:hypothetical protein